METITKQIIGTATGISILFLVALGINILPDDTHFCEATNLSYHCDNLTAYYKLPNGKCWHNELPNKLCRSGWEQIDWSKNESNSEIRGIELNKKQTYLICSKTNNLIQECQELNSDRIIYKID